MEHTNENFSESPTLRTSKQNLVRSDLTAFTIKWRQAPFPVQWNGLYSLFSEPEHARCRLAFELDGKLVLHLLGLHSF